MISELSMCGCLRQAGANAKNAGMKKVKLYISECYCDEGPILKRIKTRAKGRYITLALLMLIFEQSQDCRCCFGAFVLCMDCAQCDSIACKVISN